MNIDIVRAWKDRSYRESLSDEEQALLPENPVGQLELTEDELKEVSGAQSQTGAGASFGICQQSQGGACQSQQGACQSQAGACQSQVGQCRSFMC